MFKCGDIVQVDRDIWKLAEMGDPWCLVCDPEKYCVLERFKPKENLIRLLFEAARSANTFPFGDHTVLFGVRVGLVHPAQLTKVPLLKKVLYE